MKVQVQYFGVYRTVRKCKDETKARKQAIRLLAACVAMRADTRSVRVVQ